VAGQAAPTRNCWGQPSGRTLKLANLLKNLRYVHMQRKVLPLERPFLLAFARRYAILASIAARRNRFREKINEIEQST
jgi:hypothetical protein